MSATAFGPYMVPNTEGLAWLLAALRSQIHGMRVQLMPIMGMAMLRPPPNPSSDVHTQFYLGPGEEFVFDADAHEWAAHAYTKDLIDLLNGLEALCGALAERQCFSADDVARLRVGALRDKPPSRQMWVSQVTHDVTCEPLALAFAQLDGLVDVPYDLSRHAVLPQVLGALAGAVAVRLAAFTYEIA